MGMAACTLLDHVRTDEVWQCQRRRARSPGTATSYFNQHCFNQHCAIVDAIAARDAKTARIAMTVHLELLLENMMSATPEVQQ